MDQGMSNKILFWVAFFTLSYCEFEQFVYSSNTLAHVKASKFTGISLHDDADQALDEGLVSNDNSTSYLLPR
jgi:hypothetical protein